MYKFVHVSYPAFSPSNMNDTTALTTIDKQIIFTYIWSWISQIVVQVVWGRKLSTEVFWLHHLWNYRRSVKWNSLARSLVFLGSYPVGAFTVIRWWSEGGGVEDSPLVINRSLLALVFQLIQLMLLSMPWLTSKMRKMTQAIDIIAPRCCLSGKRAWAAPWFTEGLGDHEKRGETARAMLEKDSGWI